MTAKGFWMTVVVVELITIAFMTGMIIGKLLAGWHP